jgi:hypothetical protein
VANLSVSYLVICGVSWGWVWDMKYKDTIFLIAGLVALPLLVAVALYFVVGVACAVIGFIIFLGADLAFLVSFVMHKLDLAEREEEERNSSF